MTRSPSRYRQRLVAFVDVLGFGSLIAESALDSSLTANTIRRVTEAIDWSLEELSDGYISPRSGYQFTQFSDSFVISIDAERAGKHGLSVFASALFSVIDCFLASRLLIRGGISRGPLLHTSKFLFGPAMNRAYYLESQLARVPRIILDPDLAELADLGVHHRLSQDSDGVLFVDYFSHFGEGKAFYLAPGWLEVLQSTIEAVPRSPALDEKRAWLVSKYNAVVSNFSIEGFKSRLDTRVNDPDPPMVAIEDYDSILASARRLHPL